MIRMPPRSCKSAPDRGSGEYWAGDVESRIRTALRRLAIGHPSERDLAALCHAAELIDWAQRQKPPPPPSKARWIAICLLSATVAVVGYLAFQRSTDEVEVNLSVTSASFDVGVARHLIGREGQTVPVSRLDAWQWTHAELPDGSADEPEGTSAATLTSKAADSRVTVVSLAVPAGSKLRIARFSDADVPALSLSVDGRGGSCELRAVSRGAETVASPAYTSTVDGPAMFRGTHLNAELVTTGDVPLTILEQVPIASVSFERDVEQIIAGRFEEHTLSTIDAGTLTFIGAGRNISIHSGDRLTLKLRNGWIRSARATAGAIELTLRGEAEAATLGSSERDLRPTLLELVHAERRVQLAYGAAVWFFALLMTIWSWWRKPV
jgi:hypothetical protein